MEEKEDNGSHREVFANSARRPIPDAGSRTSSPDMEQSVPQQNTILPNAPNGPTQTNQNRGRRPRTTITPRPVHGDCIPVWSAESNRVYPRRSFYASINCPLPRPAQSQQGIAHHTRNAPRFQAHLLTFIRVSDIPPEDWQHPGAGCVFCGVGVWASKFKIGECGHFYHPECLGFFTADSCGLCQNQTPVFRVNHDELACVSPV